MRFLAMITTTGSHSAAEGTGSLAKRSSWLRLYLVSFRLILATCISQSGKRYHVPGQASRHRETHVRYRLLKNGEGSSKMVSEAFTGEKQKPADWVFTAFRTSKSLAWEKDTGTNRFLFGFGSTPNQYDQEDGTYSPTPVDYGSTVTMVPEMMNSADVIDILWHDEDTADEDATQEAIARANPARGASEAAAAGGMNGDYAAGAKAEGIDAANATIVSESDTASALSKPSTENREEHEAGLRAKVGLTTPPVPHELVNETYQQGNVPTLGLALLDEEATSNSPAIPLVEIGVPLTSPKQATIPFGSTRSANAAVAPLLEEERHSHSRVVNATVNSAPANGPALALEATTSVLGDPTAAGGSVMGTKEATNAQDLTLASPSLSGGKKLSKELASFVSTPPVSMVEPRASPSVARSAQFVAKSWASETQAGDIPATYMPSTAVGVKDTESKPTSVELPPESTVATEVPHQPESVTAAALTSKMRAGNSSAAEAPKHTHTAKAKVPTSNKRSSDNNHTVLNSSARSNEYSKSKNIEELEKEEEEEEEKEAVLEEELSREEREVRRIGGFGVFLAVVAMVFTAHQMSENPDGIYASCCRLLITLTGCALKVVMVPFLSGVGGNRGYGHLPANTMDYGYRDPYCPGTRNGGSMELS